MVNDERVTANPMFTPLDQPRVGEYLAPGLPVAINGDYPPAVAAPALGDDTGRRADRMVGAQHEFDDYRSALATSRATVR